MHQARARGRPRSFDEDKVLDALLELFWARGYASASLDQLADAAGVKRASLYIAFGDKETMYLRVLARFSDLLGAAFTEAFEGRLLADGLNAFYQLSLDQYLSSDMPRGCLVLCTAPVEAPTSAAVKAALNDVLSGIDQALEGAFKRADLPSRDSALRGRAAASILHSLAIRARAGEDGEVLRTFARDAASLLCTGG